MITVTSNEFDPVAVAKRWFGNKANGAKVACMQRDFDFKWDMLQFVPDPTLDEATLLDLKTRGVPQPYKWVTVAVVEPYVIEGIVRSLNRMNEEKTNG
jgi:hypothetical protein